MNLPGEGQVEVLGYSLVSYNGDARTKATYYNADLLLHLTIQREPDGSQTASLEHIQGLVVISLASFSFPHRRFHSFERMVTRFYLGEPDDS